MLAKSEFLCKQCQGPVAFLCTVVKLGLKLFCSLVNRAKISQTKLSVADCGFQVTRIRLYSTMCSILNLRLAVRLHFGDIRGIQSLELLEKELQETLKQREAELNNKHLSAVKISKKLPSLKLT